MLRRRRVADLQSCWGGCSAHSSAPPHHTLFVFSSPWGWDGDIVHHSVHKNSFAAVQNKPKRLIRRPEFAESAVLCGKDESGHPRLCDTYVRRCLSPWVTSTMLENVDVFHPPTDGRSFFYQLCLLVRVHSGQDENCNHSAEALKVWYLTAAAAQPVCHCIPNISACVAKQIRPLM